MIDYINWHVKAFCMIALAPPPPLPPLPSTLLNCDNAQVAAANVIYPGAKSIYYHWAWCWLHFLTAFCLSNKETREEQSASHSRALLLGPTTDDAINPDASGFSLFREFFLFLQHCNSRKVNVFLLSAIKYILRSSGEILVNSGTYSTLIDAPGKSLYYLASQSYWHGC